MIKFNIKRFALMIMALTLLVADGSFSWIEEELTGGYVNMNKVVVSSSGSLTMKQDGNATNPIIVSSFKLGETSSADGRNYFFPMADDTSTEAGKMFFRKGTPADKNVQYVSVDFTLEADGGVDEIYLGAGTLVHCDNPKLRDALRMSLSLNDGSTPIVFKPSQMPGEQSNFSPITSIRDDGGAIPTSTTTNPCGDYYYKGENNSTSIFNSANGKTLNVTLSIWLEGTAFNGDDLLSSELSIFFDFTTADKLIKYTFEDNCHDLNDANENRWIGYNVKGGGKEYPSIMYIFDKTTQRYLSMIKIKDTNRWESYIPKTVTDFYFRRYTINVDKWWNQWEPDMESIPVVNNERTYVAIYGYNNNEDGTWGHDGSYGYWKDADDTIRVFFQLEDDWKNAKCYVRNNTGEEPLGSWPGSALTFSHYAGDSSSTDFSESKPVYYIDIKNKSKINMIQFNNSDYNQRCEINDNKLFFNGLFVRYTKNSGYSKTVYTKTNDSLIYPFNDPTM